MREEQGLYKGLDIGYLPQKKATCKKISEVMISDNAKKIAEIVAKKSDYNTKIIVNAFENLEKLDLSEDDKNFFQHFIQDKNVQKNLEHVLSIYLSTIKNKSKYENFLKMYFFWDWRWTFYSWDKITINKILNYIKGKLNEIEKNY